MKSDLQLRQDVLDELAWQPAVDAKQISVEVKNGVVTLTGLVDSYAAKWHAEHAAQHVSGVSALSVEIDVKLSGAHKRSDADVMSSVKDVLEWTTSLPEDTVKVTVDDGWVTLKGQVHWGFQRTIAAAAVRYLTGVRGLSDQITIKPKVAAGLVKHDIEAALQRRTPHESKDIKVSVDGSTVTLKGTVKSWPERETAANAAWSAPGVIDVVNNITVAP